MKVTKDTLLVDIIRVNPDVLRVFQKYGMGCASCMGISNENVLRAARTHGADVDELIADLEKTFK